MVAHASVEWAWIESARSAEKKIAKGITTIMRTFVFDHATTKARS